MLISLLSSGLQGRFLAAGFLVMGLELRGHSDQSGQPDFTGTDERVPAHSVRSLTAVGDT